MSYSPEKEDPGNKKFTTENIPKVIGANNISSKKLLKLFILKYLKRLLRSIHLILQKQQKFMKIYLDQ